MDFFAIAGRPVQEVYRIEVDQQVQAELEQSFLAQAEALTHADLEVIPFQGGNFTPDDSEVLEINPFDLPSLIFDSLQNIVGCATLPADDATIASVSCIFGYDAQADRLIFQVIQKQQRLSTSSLAIFLSNNTFKKLQDPGLILGPACHAVHEGSSLKFKSMWWVKQIFDISDFYREATDADVEQFAEIPSVLVGDVAKLKRKTGQWARTRIAFIIDSGVLVQFTPSELSVRAEAFNVPLHVVQDPANPGVDKLKIPDDTRELRAVLKFLEEELYLGAITGLPYEANSKRKR